MPRKNKLPLMQMGIHIFQALIHPNQLVNKLCSSVRHDVLLDQVRSLYSVYITRSIIAPQLPICLKEGSDSLMQSFAALVFASSFIDAHNGNFLCTKLRCCKSVSLLHMFALIVFYLDPNSCDIESFNSGQNHLASDNTVGSYNDVSSAIKFNCHIINRAIDSR